MRFQNPQKARGLAGHGTKLADRFLPVRVNGDLALFAGVNKALLEREDAAPGTVLDHAFIDAHTARLRRRPRPPGARSTGRSVEELSGLARAQIEAFADDVHRRRQRDRLLGDGPDPAQERGRDDPRGR